MCPPASHFRPNPHDVGAGYATDTLIAEILAPLQRVVVIVASKEALEGVVTVLRAFFLLASILALAIVTSMFRKRRHTRQRRDSALSLSLLQWIVLSCFGVVEGVSAIIVPRLDIEDIYARS